MLELKNIRKSYKTGTFVQNALDGVSVAFRDNEFAAVLGPSGSGKTTMLNIIGGLDRYDSGDLLIEGVSTTKYKDRDWDIYRNNRIGFVFQSYNLIPHQSVLANVELALTLSGVSKKQRRERAIEALKEVGLEEHMYKKPSQLSGGQMQRVAIARALIGDPEILLADEPTGALDSQIGKQVMDLLTKIAKDRLVIMVTHNNELAEKYATRLIHLTDGVITSDSQPYKPLKEKYNLAKTVRATSMSFFNAIALSASNLVTKKGRTFITALASSIGIIGIAAIFALANGINIYIKNIEEDTLSIYPLTIQSSSFDITSLFSNMRPADNGEEDAGDKIRERRIVESFFTSRNKNDLATLKSYFEEKPGEIKPYVITIQYAYDVTPQIFLADTSKKVEQVNPEETIKSITSMQSQSSMMMGNNMTMFTEMPSEESLYINQYNVVAGRWPVKYDEVIMVLGPGGTLPDFALYALGLKDREELRQIVDSFLKNEDEEVEIDQTIHLYSYQSVMDVQFKVIDPSLKYQYDNKYDIWVDKSDDEKFMKKLVDNAMTLKIVGVVKPAPDSNIYALRPGVNYTPELVNHLIDSAAENKIVKDQLADPATNVITGKTFSYEKDHPRNTFDFSKMFSFDTNALSKAFKGSPPDFKNMKFDPTAVPMPEMDLTDLITTLASQLNIPTDQVMVIVSELFVDFLNEEISNGVSDPNQIAADFPAYLARPDIQAKLTYDLSLIMDVSEIQNQIMAGFQAYLGQIMQTYMTQMMTSLVSQIQTGMQDYMKNMAGGLQDALKNAFKFNMDEDDMRELFMAIMNPTESTYENNLSLLGYADRNSPIQISIYPKDFESKKEVLRVLDDYNNRMESSGQDDKVVHYTDIVGSMMSSVTDIVDMVSYALVAFVSISLVVSSIMIGVITYISVLERKKEIGILRAVGASKKDIRRVFNAEALIIGFCGGFLGIALTLVLCVIANYLFLHTFNIPELAQLPLNVAIILILVSMFLSYIAGLFPSSTASRKDPVEALRSE